MNSKYFASKQASCRFCKIRNLLKIWKISESAYGDLFATKKEVAISAPTYDLTLAYCLECRLLQLAEDTDIEVQYDDYLYQTKITFGLNEFYKGVVNELLSLSLSENPQVLDIGSNDGSFLRYFQERGVAVTGIEPSKTPSRVANENGVFTFHRYFNHNFGQELRKSQKMFDIISVNYTLANIPNLKDFIAGIAEVLKKDGIVSIVTGYHPDQFNVNMFDYVGHDHLTYFTVANLKRFFAEFGLKILDVKRIEHKGGSIVAFLSWENSSYVSKSTVHQLMQREKWMKADTVEFVDELSTRIGRVKSSLLEYVESMKYEEKSIAGLGASISTSYLIEFLEIGHFLNNLYDDDSLKHNRFSPRVGLKVLDLVNLPKSNQESALLLAWQHTDRFLFRLEQLAYTGRIIVPLPYLRVFELIEGKAKLIY